ncbi:MAG: 6-bladed beta-propeller [Mariniphaga sp.]|nr:6-bladed beta-propeller [Mariniphaga sp.]MDD4227072.1 6-bladed beta-propeller [Mariniphaga sp.]
MFKTVIFFFAALTLFSSCNCEKRNKDFVTYNIEEGIKIDQKMNLSLIADDIFYIPLETTDESIIADIMDIKFRDDYILVRDDLHQLLLFNRKGKFLKRIGEKGNGPNEYLHASEVLFSGTGKEIILFDGSKLKVMLFDIESGKVLREVKIDFFPATFELYNDTTFAFYCSELRNSNSGKYYHIYLMNNKLKVIDSLYYQTDFDDIEFFGFTKLYRKDNKLYCWNSNSDTIIYIDENKNLKNGFVFLFDKYRMPISIRSSMDFWKVKDDYFYIDNFIDTDNYMFINGIYKNTFMRDILYDKNEKSAKNIVFNYAFHDRGFHNDLDGSIPFWPKGSIDQSHLYDHISPFALKKLMDNAYYDDIVIKNSLKHEEIKTLLSQCTIYDNPIIFIIQLKK